MLLPTLWFITIGCRGHSHYLIKVDRVRVTLQTVFRGQKIVFLVQVTGNSLKFIHFFYSSYNFLRSQYLIKIL